jgi:peptidoglycan/LPS O-acetylase OafA/YrhL
MWGHLRNLFFVDIHSVSDKHSFLTLIYFATGFGHQAVIVFFVLSGLLVSSAVIKRHLSESWSWSGYAADRLSRLYVVLLPGLLLGYLWDKLGSTVFASTGLYTHKLVGFDNAIVTQQMGLRTFVCNSLFLQTILSPTFGSNGPLWSLSNEFWYYVLFPVLLTAVLCWAKRSYQYAILWSLLAVTIAFFLNASILAGFLVWMAGCVVGVAHARRNASRRLWLLAYLPATAGLLFTTLLVARSHRTSEMISDLMLALAFSLFLFVVLAMPRPYAFTNRMYANTAQFIAGFSYSLYVLHFPLLLLLKAWLVPLKGWQPDPIHLIYGLALGISTLTFAWLLSIVTERKTHIVRRWIIAAIPVEATSPLADQTRSLKVA